jgi:hypothetical protein
MQQVGALHRPLDGSLVSNIAFWDCSAKMAQPQGKKRE